MQPYVICRCSPICDMYMQMLMLSLSLSLSLSRVMWQDHAHVSSVSRSPSTRNPPRAKDKTNVNSYNPAHQGIKFVVKCLVKRVAGTSQGIQYVVKCLVKCVVRTDVNSYNLAHKKRDLPPTFDGHTQLYRAIACSRNGRRRFSADRFASGWSRVWRRRVAQGVAHLRHLQIIQ